MIFRFKFYLSNYIHLKDKQQSKNFRYSINSKHLTCTEMTTHLHIFKPKKMCLNFVLKTKKKMYKFFIVYSVRKKPLNIPNEYWAFDARANNSFINFTRKSIRIGD